MKYYCYLHSRWGKSMGKLESNNKKKLIEQAQYHMERLSKRTIEKNYIFTYNQKENGNKQTN